MLPQPITSTVLIIHYRDNLSRRVAPERTTQLRRLCTLARQRLKHQPQHHKGRHTPCDNHDPCENYRDDRLQDCEELSHSFNISHSLSLFSFILRASVTSPIRLTCRQNIPVRFICTSVTSQPSAKPPKNAPRWDLPFKVIQVPSLRHKRF